MSSAKDYLFEITTNSSKNSVSFTVRNKQSWFLKHGRLPLALAIFAYIFPQIRDLSHCTDTHSLREHAVLLGRHLLQGNVRHVVQYYGQFLYVVFVLLVICSLLTLQQASDTLMVVEALGVQLSSESRWRLFDYGKKREFIPISEIIDIVIHEGFHGYGQVIFYMCVLTREKDNNGNGVKVIFPNFLPRKEILLQAWKSSRQMLYGTNRRHYRHVPGQGLREVKHLHE